MSGTPGRRAGACRRTPRSATRAPMARRRGSSASPSSATASSDRVTARPRDLLVSVLVKRMKATVRLRRLALFAAAAVPIALAAVQSGAAVFNPKTFTLGNGLQVVLVENHRVPAAVQMVWYRVGAADEPRGESGIAHFLEHPMFKGTRTVEPGDFSKVVARHGGRDNAFTGHDYTAYHQTIAKDYLDLVMEMEADRMANLVLTDAVVDPERQGILEERRSRIATVISFQAPFSTLACSAELGSAACRERV